MTTIQTKRHAYIAFCNQLNGDFFWCMAKSFDKSYGGASYNPHDDNKLQNIIDIDYTYCAGGEL